jgi:hypothetical protein
MSAAALPIAPSLARIFGHSTGPAADLNALLERIHQRRYPETVPVLASWWLKTTYFAGHNRAWWGQLDAAVEKLLRTQSLDATAAEAIRDIRAWVRKSILPLHKAPGVQPLLAPPFRDLAAGQAAPYLSRVLNDWLPGEVARQLTTEVAPAASDESGMPPLVVAKVLERLLLREHFSPSSLEILLEAGWFSPKYAYPAHVEIFCDIVLALLGRTAAPRPPVLPATLLAGGFAEAVGRAALVPSQAGDEIHVPLDPSQALELIRHDPVRIESILVTMDGRWWEANHLESGLESVVVYRPGGRLRIDFNSDHARLLVPWSDHDARWQGAVHLPEHIDLFGREWRGQVWERSAGRTWLHLEFTGILTLSEALDRENPRPRQLRPASIEMAWSEVELALAAGVSDSIDQLHRGDLVPLAHALKRMVDCLLRRPWPPSRADVERSLRSVQYLHGGIAAQYGPIPWRVLPVAARTALLRRRGNPAMAGLIAETFEGTPPDARTSPHRAA